MGFEPRIDSGTDFGDPYRDFEHGPDPDPVRRSMAATLGLLDPGVCRICGCTDDRACHDETSGRPCSWADATRTLCTACIGEAQTLAMLDDDDQVDDGPPIELGPCCCCGGTDRVEIITAVPMRSPTPGEGWGCEQCGLPNDGAIVVACDACYAAQAPILRVCAGPPKRGERVSIFEVTEPFDHRPGCLWK